MKKNIVMFLSILALSLFCASPTLAITLGFEPSSQYIQNGTEITVDIVVSDLGDEIVAAFDLDIAYDATVLTATDVIFGSDLGGGFLSLQTRNLSVAGLADLKELSLMGDGYLASIQSDTITLATLVFSVISDGSSDLTFIMDQWNDIKGLNAQVLNCVIENGSVSPVPEPASLVLLSLGIGGFVGFRKRSTRT